MFAYIPYEYGNSKAVMESAGFLLAGDACLKVSVSFHENNNAILKVYEHRNSSYSKLVLSLSQLQVNWRTAEADISGYAKKLSFIAQSGHRTGGGIAIDDVTIETSRCSGVLKVSCDFDGGTLCDYTQASDDSFDWTIKTFSLHNALGKSSLENSDHFIEADGMSRTPGEKTRVFSPLLNSSVPQCLSFVYKIDGPYVGILSVCTQSEFDGEMFLNCNVWFRSTSKSNDWTIGRAQIPPSQNFRIGLQAKRGTVGGKISVDNVTTKFGNCQ
ncbi:MAM and LDL-receptor class A domain-containing protein 1-like [Gigantopelta aegis]|uniref:MAM and LDL-receptor class A domain-containing protein 1-like n=1 Tax=Gigantopelta aegis TaxID=1735272 RepID=UPI001B88C00A|nr:MAM and LDL-receptor class A domain-containing protein 1-like [Gigantopelta aegis]